MSAETAAARFYVRLAHAPGALERLLQPFTVVGAAPRNMVLRPSGDGTVFVALEVAGLDAERCAVLTRRVLQSPSVRCARFTPPGGGEAQSQACGIDALDAVA
jgi:hypothetical protein